MFLFHYNEDSQLKWYHGLTFGDYHYAQCLNMVQRIHIKYI